MCLDLFCYYLICLCIYDVSVLATILDLNLQSVSGVASAALKWIPQKEPDCHACLLAVADVLVHGQDACLVTFFLR